MTLGLVGESMGRKEGWVSLLCILPSGQAAGGPVDAVALLPPQLLQATPLPGLFGVCRVGEKAASGS